MIYHTCVEWALEPCVKVGCSINVCNSLLRQAVLDGWSGGCVGSEWVGSSWSVFGYL